MLSRLCFIRWQFGVSIILTLPICSGGFCSDEVCWSGLLGSLKPPLCDLSISLIQFAMACNETLCHRERGQLQALPWSHYCLVGRVGFLDGECVSTRTGLVDGRIRGPML